MLTPTAEFLQLLDKLNILCNTLLKSNNDLQITREKSEEKLSLEMKMRGVQRACSVIAQQKEVGQCKKD